MTKQDLDKRKTEIDNFVKAKKAAKDPSAVNVTPAKVPATKIPAELNATTGKSKKQLRRENEAKKNDTPTETIKEKADKELDENVKPKKAAKDPNMLSVSQVAAELGLDPKRARAKLRGAGQAANEGRWPLVKRDSKEHKALIDLLKPSDEKPAKAAKTKPAKEDDEDEETTDDEEDEE